MHAACAGPHPVRHAGALLIPCISAQAAARGRAHPLRHAKQESSDIESVPGVQVMPNLYGDIISDLCAGLIGGAFSDNAGQRRSTPSHNSARCGLHVS